MGQTISPNHKYMSDGLFEAIDLWPDTLRDANPTYFWMQSEKRQSLFHLTD